MPRPRKSVADHLRQAIRRDEKRGLTRYQISKASGVSQTTLSLFMAEPDRQLRLDVAERLAEALDLRLRLTPPGR